MDSPLDDMTDLDLDRIVDDKLKQSEHERDSSDSEENTEATDRTDKPSDDGGGWIRANTARPRRGFLSPKRQ